MKILVAIDFSESVKLLIAEAKKMAKAQSAKIWLLHVAEPDPDFVGYSVDTEVMRDVTAERYHKEHQLLQEYSAELSSASLDCASLLIQGSTIDTILEQSDKLSADILVLGSHGKGIVKQLLVGSTSEGVIRKSRIPVLIVPTHGQS